jgi:hypothetical protein
MRISPTRIYIQMNPINKNPDYVRAEFTAHQPYPITGRNLYPYIRLGPRCGGKIVDLTVCVTCVWAGVDSGWEQEKLEAWKKPENGVESHSSSARFVRRFLLSKTR